VKDYPGVYVGRCTANGKSYVGSSIKVLRRQREHKSALAKGNHQNKHLQSAYNKYGAESFEWEVLVKNPTNLFAEEQVWIEKLRSSDREFGFNRSYPVRVNVPNPIASKIMKRYWKDPVKRAAWEAALLKGSRKVSELLENDPEFAAKISAIRQGMWTDEIRLKASKSAKGRYKNKKYKKEHLIFLAAGRATLAERQKDPDFVDRQTQAMRDRWKDPEARKLQAARMAALWQNPEFRAKAAERSRQQIIAYNKARKAASA
jgi:hypothetical protein